MILLKCKSYPITPLLITIHWHRTTYLAEDKSNNLSLRLSHFDPDHESNLISYHFIPCKLPFTRFAFFLSISGPLQSLFSCLFHSSLDIGVVCSPLHCSYCSNGISSKEPSLPTPYLRGHSFFSPPPAPCLLFPLQHLLPPNIYLYVMVYSFYVSLSPWDDVSSWRTGICRLVHSFKNSTLPGKKKNSFSAVPKTCQVLTHLVHLTHLSSCFPSAWKTLPQTLKWLASHFIHISSQMLCSPTDLVLPICHHSLSFTFLHSTYHTYILYADLFFYVPDNFYPLVYKQEFTTASLAFKGLDSSISIG